MPMTAPLFLESQTYTSTLYLVNQLNFGVEADVTAYDMSGALLTTGHFYLEANTSQTISVRKLLSDAGLYAEVGSIEAVSPENSTALLGQLSITRSGDNKAFLDEELFMPERTTSSSLRAVIDSPQNSPVVSVTNVSPTDALTVHLTCTPSSGSVISKTVNLQSKQTKLVRACSTLGDLTFSPAGVDAQFVSKPESSIGMAGEQVAGISITADGPIGDVAAFGFVEHADTYGRYFSAMNFADTGLLNSTGTVFAGVPVGTSAITAGVAYTPQVALTNFSDTPQTTSIYLASSVAGESSLNKLIQVALPPKSSQLVALPQAESSPQWQNSFIVRSSGQPGDVLSKMMFKTVGSLPNIELIGKDELDLHNAGDHPWSIENGIGSTLYLFNHSDATRKVTVRLGSGSNVWLKIYDLQPNETKSLAVGDLIQRQVPDDNGFVFPRRVTHGEVAWWAPADGAPKVSGRVVQTDSQGIMARNFSCGTAVVLSQVQFANYSGYYQVQSGQKVSITPQPVFAIINLPQYSACPNSYQTTAQNAYLSWSWSVGQILIAHIVDNTFQSQTVHLEGESQGSTAIQVSATTGASNSCTALGNLQVTAPNSITSVSPMVYGGTGTVTIQGVGFYGTPTVTSQSGNITFSNAVTNNTTTITANYSVACGSTTDSIMLNFAAETQPYAPYPVQLTLPNAPTPTIKMGGSTVSGTTTSAVAGQPIALTSNIPALPNACLSVASQNWGTPTGLPIAGYIASTSNGTVNPFTVSATGTQNFYWTSPSAANSPWTETFSYTMSGGGVSVNSPIATASFNVDGPTSPTMSLNIDPVYVGGRPTALELGDYPTQRGALFTASATSPQSATGSFQFVQLITRYDIAATRPQGDCSYSFGTGLDNSYPYGSTSPTTTNDSPEIILLSDYTGLSVSFNAVMYLMWKSTSSTAIPIPLGYVNWGWSGTATGSSPNWALTDSSTSPGNFTLSTTYPTWQTLVTNAAAPSNCR